MGLFDRVERRLESVVNGAFARAFKAEVQPVEIASAMRRAMDDRAAVIGEGRVLVPNAFTVELAPTDYQRLTAYRELLADELIASAEEHAESQRYVPSGQVDVEFTSDDALETGVFRVRATADKHARRVTRDPGRAPEQAPPPPQHAPRVPRPSEATASAHDVDSAVGVASQAAAAAGGAMAGTAAAARSHPGDAAAQAARPGQGGHDVAELHADRSRHAEEPTAAAVVTPPAPVAPLIRPSERPWLEIDGDTYPLLLAITVVGRDPSVDITLDDPGISRRHCEIRVTHDGPHFVITVRDLGSTNGTFLNGERVATARAVDGDRVTIGRTSFHVRVRR